MPEIAVVHLVRKRNGLEPFERFLTSYLAHTAGIAHELVILFKGFHRERGLERYDQTLASVKHERLFIPDRGYDLGAYWLATQRLEHRFLCFLNSYSRILDSNWLDKFHRRIVQKDVGLVGATGSWQSMATDYIAREEQIDAPREGGGSGNPPSGSLGSARPSKNAFRDIKLWMLHVAGLWRPARDFPLFPNYHLRSNAFMGARDTLVRVHCGSMRTKLSAYRLESGNNSITNQILNFGKRVLVVGRDGEAYEPARWHISNTFWQSEEENLLVSDNQTDAYLNADRNERARLAGYAWGDLARVR